MKLLHFLGFWLIRLIGLLPYRVIYALGWCLGWLYWLLSARDRYICHVNMRLFYPELSKKEQKRRARLSMRHIATNILEGMWTWTYDYENTFSKKIKHIEGLEILQSADQDPRGLVMLVPHFGCWEVMSHFLGHHCERTIFLARNFGIPKLDKHMTEGRIRSGGEILPTNRDGLTELYQKTADGYSTAVLSDQAVNPKYAVFAPWMGHLAATGAFVPDLLQKTGSQAIFAGCKRLPWGQGYQVRIFSAPDDIYSKDPLVAATAMNECFAQIIAWAPEQYTWNYRRITKTPDGGETRYYDYPTEK